MLLPESDLREGVSEGRKPPIGRVVRLPVVDRVDHGIDWGQHRASETGEVVRGLRAQKTTPRHPGGTS